MCVEKEAPPLSLGLCLAGVTVQLCHANFRTYRILGVNLVHAEKKGDMMVSWLLRILLVQLVEQNPVSAPRSRLTVVGCFKVVSCKVHRLEFGYSRMYDEGIFNR